MNLNLKKVTAISTITLVLTAQSIANAIGVTFSDVPSTHTFYSFITELADKGIVSGYSDGTFKPDTNITRAQMAKLIVKGIGIQEDNSCDPFSDVPSSNVFYTYITTLKCKGIINGYSDGTFKPDELVNRGAAMKFVIEAIHISTNDTYTAVFSDVPTSHTFFKYVMVAYKEGIVSGYSDGTYKPEAYVSRGAMTKMISNGMKVFKGEPIPTPTPITSASLFSNSVVTQFLDDDYGYGSKNTAKAVITVFVDYGDPYSFNYSSITQSSSVLTKIKTDYVDTGKAVLVFRDYPLGMYQGSDVKAEAVECAQRDVKTPISLLGLYQSILYKTEASGTRDQQIQKVSDAAKIIDSTGSTSTQIKTCLTNQVYKSEVAADKSFGTTKEVMGTPTTFITGYIGGVLNTTKLDGMQTYSTVAAELDKRV